MSTFLSVRFKNFKRRSCGVHDIKAKSTRSNRPAWKRSVPGNSGDFVEAVFRPEIFRIFSNDFRSVPVRKHRNLAGIYRKKSENFPAGILLPCCSDFRCFPAGYVDFSASFLQDPVAGIIGLGIK